MQSVASARAGFKNRVCFTDGVPLLTDTGSKSIETFKVGDRILSKNEHDVNSDVGVQVVEEVFVRYGQVLWLTVNSVRIGTTAEHPFWVVGKGWTPAGDLAVGDVFVGHDGRPSTLEAREEGDWATVYNLRVIEWHTYFVGCDEWGFSVWAHNADYETRLQNAAREKAEALLRKAIATEPEITAALQGVAGKVPAELVGLEYRLKGVDSLARKLADRARQFDPKQLDPVRAIEKAAAKDKNVNDLVRYTLRANSAEEYAAVYAQTKAALEAQGYAPGKVFNAWEADLSYRGVNATFRSPHGQLLEVQFHTPESFAMQKATHGLYEEFRLSSTPAARQAELQAQMMGMWQGVPVPTGAGGLR